MLEVATVRMFTEPSILETITSVMSVLRQYEGVGGSTPPAASEEAEEVPEESAAGTESAVVASAPSPTREDHGASLPQPAETVASAPAAAVADVAEGVLGDAGPPSLLTVYFGTPSMFVTLWFGFDYGTNSPLGTLII
jgi:hypothetical protein